MKRYYVRVRATPCKPSPCFVCLDQHHHANLVLDFGRSKITIGRACAEEIGITISPVGEEALRTFVGTALGNLASAAFGDAFGPELRAFGGMVGRLRGDRAQEPPSKVIDVEVIEVKRSKPT